MPPSSPPNFFLAAYFMLVPASDQHLSAKNRHSSQMSRAVSDGMDGFQAARSNKSKTKTAVTLTELTLETWTEMRYLACMCLPVCLPSFSPATYLPGLATWRQGRIEASTTSKYSKLASPQSRAGAFRQHQINISMMQRSRRYPRGVLCVSPTETDRER